MSEHVHDAESVFMSALEKVPTERAAFVEAACAGNVELLNRVRELLACHDQSRGPLDVPPPGLAGTITAPSPSEKPGTIIGPYKLLQQIGEGGMGIVFMAEQTQPVQRKVALKIIKPGMDSRQVIARFEAERQALAMMDHVNIARVIDGGTISSPLSPPGRGAGGEGQPPSEPGGVSPGSGRPYFVMELIHGIPITKYCDDNHLTPRERLELFVPVCQAIQHAHQKGIIHRDIKPSNVLVTLYDGKPVPKVIDFGVAKATEQKLTERTLFTNFGTMVGTLEYMSPEQAEMSALGVDTRSDIYSLGVLLYELLTGSTPLSRQQMKNAAYAELLRILKDEEPQKPSTRISSSGGELASISALRKTEPAKLSKLVRGELDWIVMKTLEKERNRRYETANGLARDIERYLADESVEACPPSAGYRLRKFVRRYRTAVLAAALVLLALVGGTAGTTVGLVWARQAEADARALAIAADTARAEEATQRRLAAEEAAIARAVSDFLQKDLLRLADSHKQADRKFAPNPDVKVRTLLDRAAASVGNRFEGQPRVEAAVRQAIGRTYKGLGAFDQAITHLTHAWDLRVKVLGPDHPDTLATLNNLALAYQDAGRTAEAIRLLEQVKDRETITLGPDHPEALTTLCNLALAYQDLGRTTEAIKLLEQIRDRRTAVLGAGHPDTLIGLNNLALAYRTAGRTAEAIRLLEQVRDRQAAALAPDHPNALTTLANLALAYKTGERTVEAIRLWEQVRDRQILVLGPDHPDTLSTLNDLATAYRDAGRNTEAIKLLEQIRDRRTAVLGAGHPDILITVNSLALAYRQDGRTPEAIRMLKEALEQQTAVLGRDHPYIVTTINNLAVSYWSVRQFDKSVPLLEEGLRKRRERLGEDHPNTVSMAFSLAVNYRDVGRLDEAIALFDEWLARSRVKLGPDHHETLYGLSELVEALARAKQFERAAAACRELLDVQSRKLPADHPTRTGLLAQLGKVLLQAGRPAEAEPVLRECLVLREKKQPDHWNTFNTRALLGRALCAQEKPAEAEPLLLQGYEGLRLRAAKIPAARKGSVADALEQLIQLYDGWGKKDKADEWRKKLDEQKQ